MLFLVSTVYPQLQRKVRVQDLDEGVKRLWQSDISDSIGNRIYLSQYSSFNNAISALDSGQVLIVDVEDNVTVGDTLEAEKVKIIGRPGARLIYSDTTKPMLYTAATDGTGENNRRVGIVIENLEIYTVHGVNNPVEIIHFEQFEDLKILNCRFIDLKNRGIYLEGGSAHISGCRFAFDSTSAGQADTMFWMENVGDSQITDNVFDTFAHGVSVTNPAIGIFIHDATQMTMKGNTAERFAWIVLQNWQNSTITGESWLPSVEIDSFRTIVFGSGHGNVKANQITGNNFQSGAFDIANSENLLFSGNSVDNLDLESNTKNCLIIGNNHQTEEALGDYFIRVRHATVDSNVIMNNFHYILSDAGDNNEWKNNNLHRQPRGYDISSSISGLVLWLDAEKGVTLESTQDSLTTWADISQSSTQFSGSADTTSAPIYDWYEKAFVIDTVDDVISFSNWVLGTTDETWGFNFWMRDFTMDSGTLTMFAGGSTRNNFFFSQAASDSMGYRGNDNTYYAFPNAPTSDVRDKDWQMITLVGNGTTISLYINSVLQGAITPGDGLTYAWINQFGKGYSDNTTFPSGFTAKEVSACTDTLSLTQIQFLYNMEINK
jgi:hypothetical protein